MAPQLKIQGSGAKTSASDAVILDTEKGDSPKDITKGLVSAQTNQNIKFSIRYVNPMFTFAT